MTLPHERTRSLLFTEEFLLSLCNPKETPRVPSSVRKHALRCLRHYPTSFDVIRCGKNDVFDIDAAMAIAKRNQELSRSISCKQNDK